jgi:PAS domain S-box-containing protein
MPVTGATVRRYRQIVNTSADTALEAIIRSANDAIVTVDAAGRVLLWNPYAERLFGYSSSEMTGQLLTAIIPERYRERHQDDFDRVAVGGDPHVIGNTVEHTALHRDGSEFSIELSRALWDVDGERFFVGIIRDITERKEAEAEIRRVNDTLAEKNEILEGLAGKLSKYLSRQVYDSVFEGRTQVEVGSYRSKLTVFFSDIQGFTELTDSVEPEAVSHLLNRYLGEMSRLADEQGGTVDKFMGDGIMVFFGDPESRGTKEDALACVRMATAMRDSIEDLKVEWRREAGAMELHVRMGINTGYCTVGNFGSSDRLDYTIVGREVNTASRLETSADPGQIHISHTTYELVKDEVRCSPAGPLEAKGIAHTIKTYQIDT